MASKYPRELGQFYASLTNSELKPGLTSKDFYVTNQDGLMIHFYRPSSRKDFPIKSKILSLCLNSAPKLDPMKYLTSWIDQLISLGASLSGEPKAESFGVEAWLDDPEGNSFLVLVPGKKIN